MPKNRLKGLIRVAELIASRPACEASVWEVEAFRADLEWLIVRGLITAGQAADLLSLVPAAGPCGVLPAGEELAASL